MLTFLKNIIYIKEIDGKRFTNITPQDGILKSVLYFDGFDEKNEYQNGGNGSGSNVDSNIFQLVGGASAKIESPTYVNIDACSPPSKKTFEENSTCFTRDSLKLIAKSINSSPDMSKIENIESKGVKELWEDIKLQMKGCNNEWCWLSKSFLKKLKNSPSFRNTFKIPIPDGKYEWLTTDDIEFTINQFIPLVPNSVFLGAVPNDFATFSGTKNRFGASFIRKLINKGIRQIGIVVNTDPHTEGGKHWVSIFIKINKDGTKGNAYYYDSFGVDSSKEIRDWIDNFPINLTYEYNKVQHQYDNSECGVYSIHFIVRMLFGWTFDKITSNIIDDVEMNAKRKEYFNPFK